MHGVSQTFESQGTLSSRANTLGNIDSMWNLYFGMEYWEVEVRIPERYLITVCVQRRGSETYGKLSTEI